MTKARALLVASLVLLAIAASAHGAGYRTVAGSGDDAVPVVVVRGTPGEMGLALGSLLKAEIQGLVKVFLGTLQAAEPEEYSNEALDKAWASVGPYTSPRFEQELRGIAEGAGIPFETLRRLHMIPVVSEYSCSGAAIWGKATRNGNLYQIRNLDYMTEVGLQDFPAVVVYIPDKGVAHVNVTFAGYIGVNTGMNAAGIALTEMGDSPASDKPYDLDGVHFTTMFRDILYDAGSLDDAVSMVKEARRIKKYHYIIGDGASKQGVKMLAHAPDLVIWRDNDETDEVAPRILDDVVYNAEGRDPIAYAHLKKYAGRYDHDAVIQLSKSVGSLGGNLLNVVYDATDLELWVAYAEGDECAYRRVYVHVPFRKLVESPSVPEGAVVFERK